MADFSYKKISPKLGGERGARNPNGPTSSHDLVEQMEFLYVEVIKAINNSAQNTIAHRCIPVVEITLGNYKSSTKNLPIDPKGEWNQVFAFDKSKGDVLSVTMKDGHTESNTVIGKQNFKLVLDIPSRVPPDARIAPQWYSMQNTETGYHMALLMSIWFGTQADEVYSNAWFSDACDVSASCVTNTRPKLYLAPRLCYVRVTIVSGHDLISSDKKQQNPSVYVKATLGRVALKTVTKSGLNPSWNQDLIFVASEPLEGTVYISLIEKSDENHEECIGKLKKKLSEMNAMKVPGLAPVQFYDIEPPGDIQPAGDTRRFASRIKMKLATDQAYHVFDECSQYCSDYRAFAKGLWTGVLGKLEVGILGATGLTPVKDSAYQRNAYVVAKYGNKWARTRTVVDNKSPKWNEQYSWDVYEKCTVLTLGVYDNQQIVTNYGEGNDGPIGKVRIPLGQLKWNMIYAGSWPIMELGKEGLKKKGELQLAVRCASVPKSYAVETSVFRWMLPKTHYKFPMSLIQKEELRAQAVEVNCMNLARTEPPLRNEVVRDMLKPKSNSFSWRRAKANQERLWKSLARLFGWYAWLDANVRSTTAFRPKLVAFALGSVLIFLTWWVLFVAYYFAAPLWILWKIFLAIPKLWTQGCHWLTNRIDTPPPLVLVDLKLSKLDPPSVEELDEEFDLHPSSVDPAVRMTRYEKLRKTAAHVVSLMGDAASQCERLYSLWKLCVGNELVNVSLLGAGYVFLCAVYTFWDYVNLLPKVFVLGCWFFWINFPCCRNDLPSNIMNFFRRLPSNEDLMI
ncbi:unnamed protein product [Thlaspi arvense]|uniref:C2 domain-containing protein n=1 Tax=Thlaspi arvense TaxID=13288 RepID=A0AAU9SBY8_THLAR|nr:unnamed protein product [Thlaspi arvense]